MILDGLVTLPNGLLSQLSGRVLVIPANEINARSYQDQLGLNLRSNNDSSKYELVFESSNPFFSGVFSKTQNEVSDVNQRGDYLPEGSFTSLLKLRSGLDLLVQRDGLYVFSSSLDNESGNLVTSPLFVPIMYKLAAGNDDQRISYSYPLSKVSIPYKGNERPLSIVGENYSYIPSFSYSGNHTMLEVPNGTPSGFYWVLSEDDSLIQIGVNTVKSESLREKLSKRELEAAASGYDNVQVYELNNDLNISAITSERSTPYWKYALLLTLLLILVETLLHRFFK